MHDIMAAARFDKKAYLKKAAQLDALHDKMRKNMEAAVASVAGKLPPAEREKLFAFGMHRDHGGPWDHRPHDGHGWQHMDRNSQNGRAAVRDDNGGSPRHDE